MWNLFLYAFLYGLLVMKNGRRFKMGCKVIRFDKEDLEKVKSLYRALSLLEKDGLQIVSVSDIKNYKEYEPAIGLKSLAELFILAGKQAIDD